MKTLLSSTAVILFATSVAFAAGDHEGGHSEDDHVEHGHADGHGHGHDQALAAGIPGDAENVSRTIEVSMIETEDGDMIFTPASVDITSGETIRFSIVNKGELEHEFVLDTIAQNAEHKALMEQFPEMEHDDPNSVRLDAGETGEIIWTFSNAGEFEFACLIPGHYEAGMHSSVKVAGAQLEYTKGVVKKVNANSGKVTIIHEELKSLNMPAMTMVFRVSDDAMLEQMEPGDNIEFTAERLKGKITVTNVK